MGGPWALLGVCLLGAFAWRSVLKPYQKQRGDHLPGPPSADLQGKGYQINQSRIAIGAGGMFGQGFTSGSQTQLNFLPVKDHRLRVLGVGPRSAASWG